ncbi:MAG: endonuclease [Leptospirales bacterium]
MKKGIFKKITWAGIIFSGWVLTIHQIFPNDVASNSGTQEFIQNTQFTSFSAAKRALYKLELPRFTFYCECPYSEKREVDQLSCGFTTTRYLNRASVVEAEHVVPASKLCGKTRQWLEGSPECISKNKPYKGRKCAEKHNIICKRAHNDLHNLRPAVGAINAVRSNHEFGTGLAPKNQFGTCEFSDENKISNPADNLLGNIARVYLFMHYTYTELDILTGEEIKRYEKWSRQDVVSEQECKRNDLIFEVQHTYNEITRQECNKAGL